jgi:hypothetical protein
MLNTNVAKVAIQNYTERKVTDIKVHPDPKVVGTYAIRSTLDGEDTLDFLVVGYKADMGAGRLVDLLEECEFETWPPTSGAPKFFY